MFHDKVVVQVVNEVGHVQVVNEVGHVIVRLEYPVESHGKLVEEIRGRPEPKRKAGVDIVLILPVDAQ